mmetsp:Transcript_28434/g.28102  ORF Transcript_28434/g.28102 Transcript_28434/m.28102 type:complete len:148 (-) Transcript_28434:279-722(-)|eukprot:CAMPEP_0202944140 /NCGR_PEP_ID=MMETSP1395-20130829/4836_1 /ASSEMBLY_ACC=CAM_ASM_000871 /TAXON_ID=5961 /ORGANISM="Blepharisma japonicum, Strain Stock R1072" /LENGTH=147 /DNA_ID=CAMNT_0049642537 /DNA_START=26 /DNA_END=469 /DNA_ORIENTATION=-
MSNILLSQSALDTYNSKVKPDKANGFGFFVIEGEKTVECKEIVGAEGKSTSETWAAVTAKVTSDYRDKPAYIVGNFAYSSADGDRKKLILVSWCPEDKIKVKAKMLHGSSLQSVKTGMDGVQAAAIVCTTLAELEHANILSVVTTGK